MVRSKYSVEEVAALIPYATEAKAKCLQAFVSEGGNVSLVRAAWNAQYLDELCNFPTGKYDDQVDASSCAFNSLLLEPVPRKAECTW